MDYQEAPLGDSSDEQVPENRPPSDSPLPISTSEKEKERANNLIRKIEQNIGSMIVDEVRNPSTDYTEETAILVAARLGHQLPSCHKALHRLGIPPKDSLIFSALGKKQVLN